jgi:hypothetical protein
MAAKNNTLRPLKSSELPPEAAEFARGWRELQFLRVETYRIVLPDFPAQLVQAATKKDGPKLAAVERDADHRWAELTGVPPLNTPDNLEIVLATVVAAGYPPTRGGLFAWTIARNAGLPKSKVADAEEQIARTVMAIGDDNAVMILGITQRSDLCGEEKLRRIAEIDSRYKGKKSTELAALIGVEASCVRGYQLWKDWRREMQYPD